MRSSEPLEPVLAEAWFPVSELSQVIASERRARDPAYAGHRWWARRPPALLRAILLAVHLPANTSRGEFWRLFGSDSRPLSQSVVLDPFIGGGSTLIEAARLGAAVEGGDIDPLAVRIVRRALEPAPIAGVRAAGAELLDVLRRELGHLYPEHNGATPIHYFSLAEILCPRCSELGLVHRDLVIARDAGKAGAVVRDEPLTVFCPDCLGIHYLQSANRTRLHCCGRYHKIDSGTYTSSSYTCRHCGLSASHRDLRTGIASRRLLAIEVTAPGRRRHIRPPHAVDDHAELESVRRLTSRSPGALTPSGAFAETRSDPRPRSYGIDRYEQLFTPRQLLVISRAFEWVRSEPLSDDVRDALELAISNALTTNNRLCGYATDYGRLSALFSVRGYSLPSLAVELNPLHPDGGRGTLAACIARASRADAPAARRFTWDPRAGRPLVRQASAPPRVTSRVQHRAADTPAEPDELGTADIAVFDPPYFDFIAYDELSAFHRSWLHGSELAGTPLLPDGENPTGHFGLKFADCLLNVMARLRRGRPLVFTYHAADPAAWQAIGLALDEAKLRVTAAWPIRSDGHMGHHSHPGNCEWDIVLVCRPVADTIPASLTVTTATSWITSARPYHVGSADERNFELALAMAADRFGKVGKEIQ